MSLNWNFEPPPPSEFADREVRLTGSHLSGKQIALLITGSIAAYRMPDLIRDFRREGADVVVYATTEGLRYVAREALEWCSQNPVIEGFTSDAEHLSDSTPFDAFVVAPASYNTLNKASLGIADSVVTAAIAAALGRMERQGIPVLFAPAMHGAMHNSILTRSMRTLQEMGVTLIPPHQSHGKNNLAPLELIVATTIRALSESPLRGKSLLITGGPTPVPVDNIRRITTRFTGALSIKLAREAWMRGA
ncbi:MAG: phosphopantothenoylcysteine decarboxylase, partial [SAR324 cluster bacterium]